MLGSTLILVNKKDTWSDTKKFSHLILDGVESSKITILLYSSISAMAHSSGFNDMQPLSTLRSLCEGNKLVTTINSPQSASDGELYYFRWCWYNQADERIVELLVKWDPVTPVPGHCNWYKNNSGSLKLVRIPINIAGAHHIFYIRAFRNIHRLVHEANICHISLILKPVLPRNWWCLLTFTGKSLCKKWSISIRDAMLKLLIEDYSRISQEPLI